MIAASEKMWHKEETFEYISLFTAPASLLKGTKAKKEKDKKVVAHSLWVPGNSNKEQAAAR